MIALSALSRATRTGVVFVHGVGSQAESGTLREFGEPLVDWLREWHRSRKATGFDLRRAALSYGGGLEGPARLELSLPAYADGESHHPAREWVVAEAWWASRFAAPSFAEMVRWSFRNLWRALAKLVEETADRVSLLAIRVSGVQSVRMRKPALSDPGLFGAFIELLSTVLLTLGYLSAALLGYVLLIPLFVIAQVPIPRFQQFVLTTIIRPLLIDSVGDFTIYAEDDIQALNIRSKVTRTIDWLATTGDCREIIIVAHSEGAVIAFDALTNGEAEHADRVTKLITFGSGLNKAFDLYKEQPRFAGTLPTHIFWLDIWAYYDPVPAGQLVRRGNIKLVDPPEALQREMIWTEHYVHPRADRSQVTPTGPLPREVTNGMNVLTDHTAYWRNSEQFVARIAQEVDTPRQIYRSSRFHFPDQAARTRRRRVRITTLVGWRLAAMYLFAIAVYARFVHGGIAQLAADGLGVRSWVSGLPGSDLLAIPGEVIGVFGGLVDLVVAPARGAPGLGPILKGAQDLTDPARYETVAMAALGVTFFASVFAVVYIVLAWLLFHPWSERERRDSIGPTLPPSRPLILSRSIAMIAPLLLLGLVVSR